VAQGDLQDHQAAEQEGKISLHLGLCLEWRCEYGESPVDSEFSWPQSSLYTTVQVGPRSLPAPRARSGKCIPAVPVSPTAGCTCQYLPPSPLPPRAMGSGVRGAGPTLYRPQQVIYMSRYRLRPTSTISVFMRGYWPAAVSYSTAQILQPMEKTNICSPHTNV
jgi:hypothetical protein